MSGAERLDSGTSRPSARLDAETRRAGVVAASWSIAQGWTEAELRDVLEGLGVLDYEPGGKTDRLGGHVFPRHRVADDDLEETA